MSEILAACIGLAGVIVGVLLTWMLGFASEIQKAKLQREHTKFTTFYSKQFEVLNEADILIGSSVRSAKELDRLIRYPFDNRPDRRVFNDNEDLLNEDIHIEYMKKYKEKSRKVVKALKENSNALRSLIEGHPRYLNIRLSSIAHQICTKSDEILDRDNDYLASPVPDQYDGHNRFDLERTLTENIKAMEETREEFNKESKVGFL